MSVTVEGVSHWALNAIVLDACTVERHEGDTTNAGYVNQQQNVEYFPSPGLAVYRIATESLFIDDNEDMVATINAAFVLIYITGADEPSNEAMQKFEPAAKLHVTPFLREFLASMTNRIAIPPYYLPLLRLRDVAEQPSEVAADGSTNAES